MIMADFILTERSRKDLHDIVIYTAKTWSEEQAVKYYDILLDACEYIARKKGQVGLSYERVRPGLYGYHVARHIVFYRILSDGRIRVVRILHDRMDFLRHL